MEIKHGHVNLHVIFHSKHINGLQNRFVSTNDTNRTKSITKHYSISTFAENLLQRISSSSGATFFLRYSAASWPLLVQWQSARRVESLAG